MNSILISTRIKRSLVPVIILCLVATVFINGARDSSASTKKPSMKKSVTIKEGSKKTVSIKTNGYKIKSVKASSADKSVATVKSTKKNIVISAKSVGNTVVTTKITTKKSKNKKSKTFTVKTSVTVTENGSSSPDPLVETVVTNQAALSTAIENANNARVILKSEDINFDIKKGNYENVDLVVDAPNAYINNAGAFRSITIKSIKQAGWSEKAEGNRITVSVPDQCVFEVIGGASIKSLAYSGSSKSLHSVLVKGSIENMIISSDEKIQIIVSDYGKIGNIAISGKSETYVEENDYTTVDKISVSNAGASLKTKITENATLNAVDITAKATAIIDGLSKNPTIVSAVKGAKITILAPNAVKK